MIADVHEAAVATVEVESAGGSYPVFVGPGLRDRIPVVLTTHAPADRVVVISDDQVGPIHGAAVAEALVDVGHDVTFLTFPEGEASKTRKSWSILTDEMLDAGLGRDCTVVAVGGGVTTDLGGFVAATYMRGVPVVQVPTSSLAMIDASVGGKTGVDVKAGKNLVGAFHPPRAVVADTSCLETLDERNRAEGFVEAIKHGAILDRDHFEAINDASAGLVAGAAEASARCVAASVRLKADVVARDEFEGGYRQVLNFGHTIGHALEAAAGYTIGHGRAVAFGMIAEARLGEEAGVTAPRTADRIADVLADFVDRSALDVDSDAALRYLSLDKKARSGRARFVLLRELGAVADDPDWSRELAPDAVAEAVGQVIAGW